MKEITKSSDIVMTRREVREFDSFAINSLGIPGVVLMENAGRNCTEIILDQIKDIKDPSVIILAGQGNNGGDGYVIARHLFNAGVNVKILICAKMEKIKCDAKINLNIIQKLDITIHTLDLAGDISHHLDSQLGDVDVIVDALFGTGLEGQLRPEYIKLITTINESAKPVIAVDIPSGLDCDTGLPMPIAIQAKKTITFAAMKKGFLNKNAAGKFTGDIYVASIGIQPCVVNWQN
ncbi:MAG: NAD(P)H-hydrate epimerase [Dehalococcoidia bacterium]|nr:MAG: NAD(P)H-hydrate epimerase [Dehalococcoidia bacterium]